MDLLCLRAEFAYCQALVAAGFVGHWKQKIYNIGGSPGFAKKPRISKKPLHKKL
jgi:hypothetical protein